MTNQLIKNRTVILLCSLIYITSNYIHVQLLYIPEIYGNSDFRVIKDSEQYGRLLFTHRVTSECGEAGDYTAIPESFVNNTDYPRKHYGENLGEESGI